VLVSFRLPWIHRRQAKGDEHSRRILIDLATPDHFIIRRHSDDESMPVQASQVDTYNPDQSADCGKILLAGRAKNGFIQVHPPQQES